MSTFTSNPKGLQRPIGSLPTIVSKPTFVATPKGLQRPIGGLPGLRTFVKGRMSAKPFSQKKRKLLDYPIKPKGPRKKEA